jgi:hypothetical protein
MAERLATFCRHLPSVRKQGTRTEWYCRLCGCRLPYGDRLGGSLDGGREFELATPAAPAADFSGLRVDAGSSHQKGHQASLAA